MGRRSDHSPEALKALALDAAQRILSRDGLQQLTVRHIAAEIGYSPGTLYNHYRNFDELILQVNAATLDRLMVRLHEIARQQEAEPALRAMARAYIEETRAEPNLWSAVYEHRLASPGVVPDWYAERVARMFQPVEKALRPMFAEADREKLRQTARILWSAVHGIAALAVSQKLERVAGLAAEVMADQLVSHYLAGLRGA